jgi:Stage II sporulation protein E (SpoIIE)
LKKSPAVVNSVSQWRTVPRRTTVAFLLAVCFIFTTFGFANDVIDLGREPTFKLGLTVALSGLFSVSYAFTGITLRGKFWKAFLPLFAIQFVVMGLLGRRLPDTPQATQMGGDDIKHLQARLAVDGFAVIAAVCLGYTGFVYVSISEGRRYAKTRTEKALLENEMDAARQVQEVLLPRTGQSFSSFVVDSVYQPAQQVGGDFFQILPVDDSGLLIVFGDVAGKGLPAAMLVSMLVGSIRATAEQTHDPVLILRKLHDRLIGRTSGGFATALAAHITKDGAVTIANAGHLSPYLDGAEISLPGALPLGISSGGQFELRSFEFRPGSRLTFISDGVVEAQNEKGELLGFDGAKVVSRQTAAEIVDTAVRFGQADDITVVTIERVNAKQFQAAQTESATV